MRRRAFLFALLTAASAPGYADGGAACPPAAEKPGPEAVQAGMRNASDHGFLWRVRRDGRTSYLYGTIHVAKADWMYPGPRVLAAIRASDTVALELDMLDPDIQDQLTQGMQALGGPALPDPLVRRLQQQAALQCIPYESLARMIPELQVTTLSMMAVRRDGLDPAYAIDSVLAGIGHGAKKNVTSLETAALQLKMFQMGSARETIELVQDGLEELESGRSRSLALRLTRAWAAGDFAEMASFNDWCECLNTAVEREMMRRMLDRNPGLAEHIDSLHSSGRQVFAAVGSLHMFGPDGLPALLAKRGYRVENIPFGTTQRN